MRVDCLKDPQTTCLSRLARHYAEPLSYDYSAVLKFGALGKILSSPFFCGRAASEGSEFPKKPSSAQLGPQPP